MRDATKVRIYVKLDTDWMKKQENLPKPPIERLIEEFTSSDPQIRLIGRDEISCTFEAVHGLDRREKLEELLISALQNGLDIEPDETYAQWEIKELDDEMACEMSNIPKASWLVDVELDSDWVLAHRNDDPLPIENLLVQLGKVFVYMTIERETLTGCSLLIAAEEKAEINIPLNIFLEDMGATEAVVSKAIYEVDKEADMVVVSAPLTTDVPKAGAEKQKESFVLKRINALIGAVSYRRFIHELVAVAPQIIKHKTLDPFLRRGYLFTLNDGCGLSTQLNLLVELLEELGLFCNDAEVVEINACPQLAQTVELIENGSFGKQLICLDISQWMDKITQPEFRAFLQKLHTLRENKIYAFRIPYVDANTRRKVLSGLNDILTVSEIVTTPYTIEELTVYGKQLLAENGFSMDESGEAQFIQRIIDEKSDGHFYGLNTVGKIVDELFYQKHLTAAAADKLQSERIVSAADVPSFVGEVFDTRTAQEQLDELVGIDSIRGRINEVLAQMKVAGSDTALRPCLHMRFVGGPGTGKTTVARILGMLLKEQGLLSKGQFFEYAGRDFCGQYIGETAPKTAAMCRDAYGSVLFIDEAYSLYRGDKENKDFGREAIDTLVAQMENHRHDFVVIMAGYAEDMNTMMSGNVGLASRMPYTIEFPNYGRDALFQIYMKMASKSFACEPALETAVKQYFDAMSDAVLDDKTFSNARFVRNLFERTWGKASVRHQLEPETPFMLCACDFENAAADREFKELQERKSRRIGFCSN